jgi:hypothetical protein
LFEERNLLTGRVQRNPAAMKLCPYCSKEMELAATVCQQCGRDWKTGVSHRKTAESQDRSSPSPPALTKGETIAGVYLLVVAAALLAGFGSSDETLSRYVEPLAIYLTMPLSLVGTVLFAWSLIHGGSVGPMVVMLAIAGLVNAFLIAWVVDRSPS